MAGPSSKVGGGYLGYSSLTDSYWNTINQIRAGKKQDLETEVAENELVGYENDLFDAPLSGTGAASAGSPGSKRPRVEVSAAAGSIQWDFEDGDADFSPLVTPYGEDLDPNSEEGIVAALHNAKRKSVVETQAGLKKAKKFSPTGSGAQGGGFSRAQNAFLRDAKSQYAKAGKIKRPRKRKEAKEEIVRQTRAFKKFAGEVSGIRDNYLKMLEAGVDSKAMSSDYIEFMNTIQQGDLGIEMTENGAYLVGQSAQGTKYNMPIDDIENLQAGLIMKASDPRANINKATELINKIVEGVDANGFRTQNNFITPEKEANAKDVLRSSLGNDSNLRSIGVDYLGLDGIKWNRLVDNDPDVAREKATEALYRAAMKNYVFSDKQAQTASAAEKQDYDRGRQAESDARAREDQRQQNIRFNERNKDKGSKATSVEDTASDVASNLANPNFWGNKKLEGGEIFESKIDGNVLSLQYKTGTVKGKPSGQIRRYNLSDSNDVERLIRDTYGDKSSPIVQYMKDNGLIEVKKGQPINVLGTPAPSKSNNIKSGKSDAAARAAALIAKHRKK